MNSYRLKMRCKNIANTWVYLRLKWTPQRSQSLIFKCLKFRMLNQNSKILMWERLLAKIKFLENHCRKHIGSCLFPWRIYWIHVSHTVNFQLFWNVRNWSRYIKRKTTEENYRPVSVLTAVFKIYESSLNDKLQQHFITIFNAFLSAYRKRYSCQSPLVKVIDDWKQRVKLGPVRSTCSNFTKGVPQVSILGPVF